MRWMKQRKSDFYGDNDDGAYILRRWFKPFTEHWHSRCFLCPLRLVTRTRIFPHNKKGKKLDRISANYHFWFFRHRKGFVWEKKSLTVDIHTHIHVHIWRYTNTYIQGVSSLQSFKETTQFLFKKQHNIKQCLVL